MNLYVINREFDPFAYADNYTSLIWANRYYDVGDFEIYLPASKENLEIFKEDFFVKREDDDMVGIIEHVNTVEDGEDGDFLTISGRSAESILDRRIVWDRISFSGTVEDLIYRLVTENVISPTLESRKIPNVVLGPKKGFTETITKQITDDNLLTVVKELCQTYGYGFKITFNESFQLVFELYKGTDYSYDQTANPYVVFSPAFDNIIKTEYDYDKTAYKNVAMVAGEGEGSDRVRQTVGTATGWNRREMFVDASGVRKEELSDTEYKNQLIEEGKNELSENTITGSFSGELETTLTYVYKEDFLLGDIVSVETKSGMRASPRIIEIIETRDENGYTCIPTFATWEVE